MTKLTTCKISYHFQTERAERKAQIDAVVGGDWGQPIKEVFITDSWKILTDKGLCFVLTPDKTMIMTYYLVTMKIVNKFYNHDTRKIPGFIERRVQQNATKFNQLFGQGMHYEKDYGKYAR